MNIEMQNINTIKPYEKNSRLHSDDQIMQIVNSIKKWGWTIPILIDEENTILAGHARFEAGKILEYEEVPCIKTTNWSEQQKKAYIIADNKLAENSTWDMGLYFNELKKLNDEGFDLSFIGIEENLNFESFKPIDNYTFTNSEIDDDDMQKGADNLSNTIQNYSDDRSDKYLDVICPECNHEFKVDGL